MDQANTTLTIDGQVVSDLHDCCVRWVQTDAGPRPELYRRGRRVTCPWSLALIFNSPADPAGGNANTE